MASGSSYEDTGSSVSQNSLALAYRPLFGSLLMGINLAWLLYGFYLLQACHFFYNAHASQNRLLHTLVIIISLTGGLHLSFATAAGWAFLVQHWGDAGIWLKTPWTWSIGSLTSGINGCLVQLFFVSRIWSLSRYWLARTSAIAITTTSIVTLVTGIITPIFYYRLGSNASNLVRLEILVRLNSVSTLTCDLLIAVTMSILFVARSRTRYRSMREVVTTLAYQSIETGAVTAVNMILYLICYEAMPSKGVYIIFGYANGLLYGNVLLFILNSLRHNAQPQRVPLRFTSPASILGTSDIISTGLTNSTISYPPK